MNSKIDQCHQLPSSNTIISCNHRSGIWDQKTMQLSRWKKILSVYPRKTMKYNKLNCKNVIKGINTLAFSSVIYSTHFLHYVIRLRKMDHKSRKLMIINKALHPNKDIERLYVKRRLRQHWLLCWITRDLRIIQARVMEGW